MMQIRKRMRGSPPAQDLVTPLDIAAQLNYFISMPIRLFLLLSPTLFQIFSKSLQNFSIFSRILQLNKISPTHLLRRLQNKSRVLLNKNKIIKCSLQKVNKIKYTRIEGKLTTCTKTTEKTSRCCC